MQNDRIIKKGNSVNTKLNNIPKLPDFLNLDITGEYVKIICPFHKDTKPSMTIYKNGSFHCFSCGTGGSDTIDWCGLKKYGVNWKSKGEMFLSIVNNFSSNEPYKIRKEIKTTNKKTSLNESDLLALTKAARIYHQTLFLKRNKHALSYLIERGIKKSTIIENRIGFSDNQSLGKAISISNDDIIRSTIRLLFKDYEFLRYRIIFPYLDQYGNCKNMAGRSIQKQYEKYLVLPGLRKPLYIPSNFSRIKPIIINESIPDSLILSQIGLNSVGVNGTSIAKDQVNFLSKYQSYLLAQNDEPSILAVARWKKDLPNSMIILDSKFKDKNELINVWKRNVEKKKQPEEEREKSLNNWLSLFEKVFFFDYKGQKDINDYLLKFGDNNIKKIFNNL